MLKQDKRDTIIIWISIIAFYFCLSIWIPFTHDDWTWKGEYANLMLSENFQNLNGRYLGNLGIIVATRSVLFKVISYTLLMMSLIFSMTYFSKVSNTNNGNKNLTLIIVVLGLLITPFDIHKQTISWFSGFYNYIPAILTSLLILAISLDIIFKRDEISKIKSISFIVIALLAQLFMENHSIFNATILLIFLLLYYKLYKKISKNLFFSFISSIIGFIIMFSNKNYIKILLGESEYQSIEDENGFLLKSADTIFSLMPRYIFFDHIFLITIISVIFSIIFIKRKNYIHLGKTRSFFILISLMILPLYKFFIYEQFKLYQFDRIFFDGLLNFIVCLIFLIAIMYLTNKLIEQPKLRFTLLSLMGSLILLAGPLLIVSPIGPRNFFAQHVIWIIIVALLISYITNANLSSRYFYFPVLILMISYLLVFHTVSVSNTERIINLKNDIKNNPDQEVFVVKKLPFEHLLQHSSPRNSFRNHEWLKSIGIHEDIKLKFISHDEDE